MAEPTASSGIYDSKTEAETPQNGEAFGSTYVRMWMDALELSSSEEKEWRKEAEEANNAFRGTDDKSSVRSFNIFHSNIETMCPALYNSTPIPDVRRRYNDADPIAKVVCDIIERALSFSIDDYDFDNVMKFLIRDGEIAGRGVPRVRYEPTFAKDEAGNDVVAYEAVTCDYVPWRYFRRGPGRIWKDVPWVAFGDFLDKESIEQLTAHTEGLAKKVPMNYTTDFKGENRPAGSEENTVFRRALVWQIWDKENKRVISIADGYGEMPLAVVDDPLGLSGFFPVPRPYQPVVSTDKLTPIPPYTIYKELVVELNDITERIRRLVRQLRPRGGYGGNVDDIQKIAEADDGELVPLTGAEFLGQNGGLANWIAWFPMDPVVAAIRQLAEQRELVKQTIYEVTGIADILRGSTVASETATAQQLKAQWGSLRIQDRQAEVARVARDLLRLKSEIIATKFSWQTLTAMTGIQLPTAEQKQAAQGQLQAMQQQAAQQQPQAGPDGQPMPPPQPDPAMTEQLNEVVALPSVEEVMQVLQSDLMRKYRVDVETDSTIRGDLTRNQEQINGFLTATASFASSMGPIIMADPALKAPAMEIYRAFARNFKLGKQAEDAIEGAAEASRKQAAQPPAPPPPDPKAEAEKERLGIEKARFEAETAERARRLELDDQEAARKHERELAKINAKYEADAAKIASDERVAFEKQASEERQALAKHQAEIERAKQPPVSVAFDANQAMGGVADHMRGLIESHGAQSAQNAEQARQNAELMAQVAAAITGATDGLSQAARIMAAPKRIVKDPTTGKSVGVESVLQ